ncbi:hypothetical protein, partial [Pseudomonas gingeri]|uniref:hypothetical protein n=1 Tax=Pseudomonas gingeri TaxID=117681 RepID=UPI001C42F1A3
LSTPPPVPNPSIRSQTENPDGISRCIRAFASSVVKEDDPELAGASKDACSHRSHFKTLQSKARSTVKSSMAFLNNTPR